MLLGSLCKTCGKEFFPTPMHVFKDSSGIYCCWTCYNRRTTKKKGIYAYKIEQYDMEGNFIDIYDSADIAAEALGFDKWHLQEACRSGKEYHGFLWKYEKKKSKST